MAIKFTKADRKRLDELNADLREKLEAAQSAVAEFNSVRAEAQEFIEGLTENYETEFDEKSEKWQESPKGQATIEWMNQLKELDWSDADEPDAVLLDELEGLEDGPSED